MLQNNSIIRWLDVTKLMVIITLFAAVCPAAGADRYPFGMCSNANVLGDNDYAQTLLDAGVDTCRVDISFGSVRPTPDADPDHWNWKPFDRVRQMRAKYPKLKYLVILGYGTKWAADPAFSQDGNDIASPPRGADVLPAESPENLYGQYVYETVRRYHDVVDAWESWNEPDLNGHNFFKGNGADFLPYQRSFYLAAKKADPNCTALFAGLCFMSFEGYLAAHDLKPPTPYPPKTSFLEDYFLAASQDKQAAAHQFYFDIMNQHSYSRASDLYDYPSVLKKLMQQYMGVIKPIWITEMGAPDSAGPFGMSADEYCDYILQSFAWGSLGGVEKFFHFQLDNSNGHGLYSAMLGTAKPALTTYRDVLVAELHRPSIVTQLHGRAGVGFLEGNTPFKAGWQSGYNAIEFMAKDGKHRVMMAFADTDQAVDIKLPAKASFATLVDRHNIRSRIEAVDGQYNLHLPGATNSAGWPSDKKNRAAVALGDPEHLVGGATSLVIEDLIAPQ